MGRLKWLEMEEGVKNYNIRRLQQSALVSFDPSRSTKTSTVLFRRISNFFWLVFGSLHKMFVFSIQQAHSPEPLQKIYQNKAGGPVFIFTQGSHLNLSSIKNIGSLGHFCCNQGSKSAYLLFSTKLTKFAISPSKINISE